MVLISARGDKKGADRPKAKWKNEVKKDIELLGLRRWKERAQQTRKSGADSSPSHRPAGPAVLNYIIIKLQAL